MRCNFLWVKRRRARDIRTAFRIMSGLSVDDAARRWPAAQAFKTERDRGGWNPNWFEAGGFANRKADLKKTAGPQCFGVFGYRW